MPLEPPSEICSAVNEKLRIADLVIVDGPIMDWLPSVVVQDPNGQCCRDMYIEKFLSDDPREIFCHSQGTAQWHKYKKFRITGSRVHSLYTASNNKKTDWKKKAVNYFWPKKFQTQATKHGNETEPMARDQYRNVFGVTVIEDCGLIVSKQNPWLGFSPDGVVVENGKPCKLIEIKCPLLGETKGIEDVLPTLGRYLNCENGNYSLKRRNEYYSQVTLGMTVLNLKVCDFIVFTKADKGMWIEEIHLDESYAANLVSTVKTSFFNNMLHEICLAKNEGVKEDEE